MLLLGLAFAHPFGSSPGQGEPGSGVVGQRLRIEVTGDSVQIEYVAEVPAMRVYREAKAVGADATYAARRIEELRDAVRASWEGEALRLEPVEIPSPARAGEGGFLEFHARGRAAVRLPGRLHVRNGNFPDESSYFMTTVTLGPGLVAERSTLLTVKDGRPRDNRNGAWRRDEAAREVEVELRRARPWEEAGGEAPIAVRSAGALPTRWSFVAGIGALGLLLPTAGLALRRWRRRA